MPIGLLKEAREPFPSTNPVFKLPARVETVPLGLITRIILLNVSAT